MGLGGGFHKGPVLRFPPPVTTNGRKSDEKWKFEISHGIFFHPTGSIFHGVSLGGRIVHVHVYFRPGGATSRHSYGGRARLKGRLVRVFEVSPRGTLASAAHQSHFEALAEILGHECVDDGVDAAIEVRHNDEGLAHMF